MDIIKRRFFVNSFITSQFLYCILGWMFHSRNIENGINRLHERALRLVYDDSENLSFRDLILKYESISAHQKNLHLIAKEFFKAKNGMVPKIAIFCFVIKPYNLHYDTDCLKNETSLMTFKKMYKAGLQATVHVDFAKHI